jgi:probable phosphoglycerate mutase
MSETKAGTELILVRHAQSEWNAAGRWQGQADPPLSATGLAQADELAASLVGDLEGQKVDLLVCSDLRRAQQTARAVGAALGLELRLDAAFRELDVGEWSGLTREEIVARDHELLGRFEADTDPDVRPGGGESRREIRVRAHRAVEQLIEGHAGGRIIVVCHLGFLRALLPGAEPANVDWIRIDGHEALGRRADFAGSSPSAPPVPGPL